VEIVSWRLTAQGPEIEVEPPPSPPRHPGAAKAERNIPLWSEAGPAKVYDRAALAVGQQIAGPAIIEERETTIVLPPDWDAVVNKIGCVTATRKA
jgi:N-methylhydantoinase A